MLETTHGCSAILEYTRIQDRSAELTSAPVKRERAGKRKIAAAADYVLQLRGRVFLAKSHIYS
jgi:hypothetical protein